MPDVTEHNAKDERERDDSEQSWVDLLVPCDTVCIHKGLKGINQSIRLVVGRRCCHIDGARVHNEHARNTSRLGALQQRAADAAFFGFRVPAISSQGGLPLKHVQHSVDRPFLEGEQPPLLNPRVATRARHLRESRELVGQEPVVGLQCLSLLGHLHFHVRLSGGGSLVACWPLAGSSAVSLTDPCYLLAHVAGGTALKINHEHRLLDGVASLRVKERLADRLEMCVSVAAGCPEQSPRKPFLL
mmetsp:Transcript_39136/g.93979  ORF Transcript_39136/g.93979 Transcript_39136/m.93979 type:complete len:244 (-) Transcript_39136:679-1410(-)